ncbi:phage tail terminator-like protein [Vreelandella venusta]|uniref:phage tail terminator-like protein n=1 Tax=Vreelandella venusta TaxID=44935 RepID=UPI0018DA689D|nr:phage tail terminator-like protein [Halomonas venusta]QPI62437.1 hypothetical protein IR195_11060 [Halomonas venusta]
MANPTFESIRLAIERRLSTWGGVPVEYDGAPQTPDVRAAIENKESWVRCTIQHGASIPAGNASEPCVRRTGLVKFQVFTPKHRGSRPAALLADSLVPLFEFYQDGHFETQAMSVQRIGESNDWYQYNATTPFRMG